MLYTSCENFNGVIEKKQVLSYFKINISLSELGLYFIDNVSHISAHSLLRWGVYCSYRLGHTLERERGV